MWAPCRPPVVLAPVVIRRVAIVYRAARSTPWPRIIGGIVTPAAERRYLDETSLGRFLRERLDAEILSNARVPTIARLFRPDYRSERHKLIVEFDGDQHYRSAKHVIEDKKRDQILTDAGYSVIRVPYFVQMTEPVIGLLFGDRIADRERFKEFPHGFISDAVVFPADFCELGVARFLTDLDRFAPIRADIIASLEQAAAARGDWRLVYPSSVWKLLVGRE